MGFGVVVLGSAVPVGTSARSYPMLHLELLTSRQQVCVNATSGIPESTYSHLFNKRGGWNKCGGGAKVAKSINVEVGINVEGGIFWKKLVHNSNI